MFAASPTSTAGKDRAQDVLRALAVGRARAELFADPLFRPAEPRANHERAGRQSDAEPRGLGGSSLDQSFDRLGSDIRGEQEEANRYPFLCTSLGLGRDRATAGEAPNDDDTR